MVLSMSANVARRQLVSPIRWRSNAENLLNPSRFLHASSASQLPRKRHFFSSNAMLQEEGSKVISEQTDIPSQVIKRKTVRSPPGKRSLRRVAVEAQRSREDSIRRKEHEVENIDSAHLVTAICVAEELDMSVVVRILRSHGFPIDPYETGFPDEQVVHTRGVNDGDIFVFPSGTVVAWSLPEDVAITLATQTLKPAAVNPYVDQFLEVEDLEFREDPTRENSSIKGDVITLGTKLKSDGASDSRHKVDTTLAKIAFSSGLARSTKLAVLESMLSTYISSTRHIPSVLSRGSLPFTRRLILQKTGELLSLRAQLNHYSELTDSLPDLFWDSRHDLGLEGYYDQVGKALDVGIRIKTLNEKMDYAQEIATVLRDTLSHKHSSHLEWIIIVLIAVEIVFAVKREWKEWRAEKAAATAAAGKSTYGDGSGELEPLSREEPRATSVQSA